MSISKPRLNGLIDFDVWSVIRIALIVGVSVLNYTGYKKLIDIIFF